MLRLPHIASHVFDTPLMIEENRLEQIIQVLRPRLTGEITELRNDSDDPMQEERMTVIDGVAVIPVMGTLMQRASWLEAASGMTSYETLARKLREALESPEVKAVLLEFDSGGGAAAGCFEFTAKLTSMRGEKPIWSVINEFCASAAYAIASCTDRVVMPKSAYAGSIGVVTAHIDQSAWDEARGLKWTYIHAGARKVDGNPHEPLSDDARSELQRHVNAHYDLFVESVAQGRNMSEADVRATEAALFMGKDAVRIGLADEIMSFEQALSILSELASAPKPTVQPQKRNQKMSNPNNKTELDDNNPTPEAKQPAASPEKPEAATGFTQAQLDAAVSDAVKTALSAERDRAQTIIKQAGQLDVSMDFALGLVKDGTEAAAAASKLIDEKARVAPANGISSANASASESSDVDQSLPVEERCKAEWDKDSKLRAEFGNSYSSFLAYKKAEEKGQIKYKSAAA